MKNLIIYSNNIFLTFFYQCVGFSPQKFSGSWKTRVMNCFIFSFQSKNRLFETPSSLTMMVKLSALPFPESLPIGPLQLAIVVVENRHAGNQKSHWDKTNKGNYHLKLCMAFVGLAPVRLLHTSMAVLYHVNVKPQRAYHQIEMQ